MANGVSELFPPKKFDRSCHCVNIKKREVVYNSVGIKSVGWLHPFFLPFIIELDGRCENTLVIHSDVIYLPHSQK